MTKIANVSFSMQTSFFNLFSLAVVIFERSFHDIDKISHSAKLRLNFPFEVIAANIKNFS